MLIEIGFVLSLEASRASTGQWLPVQNAPYPVPSACFPSIYGCFWSFDACFPSLNRCFRSFDACFSSFNGCFPSFNDSYLSLDGCYPSFNDSYPSLDSFLRLIFQIEICDAVCHVPRADRWFQFDSRTLRMSKDFGSLLEACTKMETHRKTSEVLQARIAPLSKIPR